MYSLTQAATYPLPSSNSNSNQQQQQAYVLDIARTPVSRLAAISSDQALTLLDPATLRAVGTFGTEHGNLTALGVFGGGGSSGVGEVVCTAGENGSVAIWDLRAGRKVSQFQGTSAPILSMTCSAALQTITVGTELHDHAASIAVHDVRSPGNPNPLRAFADFHSDDVTTLSHHPSEPSLLLSGSTDGLVSVHDLRVADEDEVTLQTLNLGASVHHAAFLGGSQRATSSIPVAALSHDERFAVYDVAENRSSGDAVADFGDLRASVGCRYVCDVVPKADGTGAILGAGAQE
ncbi:hypothetical protein N3K66_005819 [Trichothecium roseum]|uniref:Uncharacterized protein n=1 Tax=Trichothecium roseum TaxID=47278 RepID=A0ACC0V0A9_9HYPO|nr:hypothetical protein N3K66_005819 [Trichothecium roseum]